jgi:hypothetical protein
MAIFDGIFQRYRNNNRNKAIAQGGVNTPNVQ